MMKILVADRDGGRAVALAAQLRHQDDDFVIITVQEDESLIDSVTRARPDVVIVDMARPDRDGLDSIRTLNARQKLPVVMFVDDDDPAFMEEAIAAGVISYHVNDVALPAIKPVLRTALAFFKHSQQINSRLAQAEQQIATRQMVETAKRILMTQDRMSEPAAHRFLQRRAMDKQKRLHEIAEIFLRERGVIGK
jgi:response regulator NasT